MYRRVLLGAVSSVALVSSAFAADIYTPSAPAYAAVVLPPSWAGFYIGVNGGYGGNSSERFSEDVYPNATPTTLYSTLHGGDTIAGGFGGAQLGYNWQFGPLVAGFETDIEGSNIQGSGADTTFNSAPAVNPSSLCGSGGGIAPGGYPGACAGKNDLNVDWFGTVRARLGYAIGGTLLYATGGFAYGGVHSSSGYIDNSGGAGVGPFFGRASNSTTATGWVAGAGIEYKLTPSWTLKGEYQYIDLGSVTAGPTGTYYANGGTPTPTCPGLGCYYLRGHNSDVAFNTVRIGVNYLFNTVEAPLK